MPAELHAWPAPRAEGPVHGIVALPGSKSLTNRLLVLAALAEGPSRLRGVLRARDTELMAAALRALGVAVQDDGDDWVVSPAPLHAAAVDTGLAGTVMRFLPPVATLATGAVHFDGDPYARARPMAALLDALRQVGAEIDDGGRGALPFTVVGSGSLRGGRVHLDASASSQFVSGLLLAAARYDKGIEVVHTGRGAVPSLPHVEMTLDTLRRAGVEAARTGPSEWQVLPGAVRARDEVVEPDLSNAAPFLAAALVTGGSVSVPGWPVQTTQAGDALRELLAAMGAVVELGDDGLTVSGSGTVRGIDADLHAVGELTPVLAALAALADGPSRLRGIAHLRGHETDRLTALAAELTARGAAVREQDDGLLIEPRPLRGGRWHAYADHRMATAGAVLGLAVPGVEIDDITCTSKTLPDFPAMWARLLSTA